MPDRDPTETERLSGTVERVTFFNEENGFAIVKVRVAGHREPVTVVGTAATVTAGEELAASGRWTHNANFGRQFKADSIETKAPDGCGAIARYLGSGLVDGIGPVYAEKIVAKFGAETLDVIDNASKRLEEIDGIGPKRRREIKESWERQKSIRSIMLFLHRHKVPAARAVRIYKHYGESAIDVLTNNPYQLAEDVWGIGFKTADQIAANLGITGSDPRRLEAGVLHQLEAAAADGHTALPRETLERSSAELLGAGGTETAGAVDALLARQGLRTFETDGGGGTRVLVALPRLLYAEQGVARRMKTLAAKPAGYPPIDVPAAIAWAEEKTGTGLAQGQRAATETALTHRVLVITGGPGVGKTTLVNTILAILRAKGVTPCLAAPTGRAAKRLSESAGLEAKTLHRLLEYQPARGFARNAERPLEDADLFVLDEASMVDAPLMHAFLQALPDDAHLLVVGDVDQLPSVGPGAVLGDLIASGAVPVARLTEIFRQAESSQIVRAAHAINQGHTPGSNLTGSDFFFIERGSPGEIADTVPHLVRDRIPGKFGFDPATDIQVLTPMHRGPAGSQNLNRVLQAALNPPSEFKPEVERFGSSFRAGDKVIQTRNNYELDVYNGDIGTVVEITTDPVLVRVRFGEAGGAHSIATYATTELDELQPAYAITVHKSQGSEFPCVVVPVTTAHFVMLQRNLFYTAITRARKLVVLVGQPGALATAARTTGAVHRSTTLRQLLTKP